MISYEMKSARVEPSMLFPAQKAKIFIFPHYYRLLCNFEVPSFQIISRRQLRVQERRER